MTNDESDSKSDSDDVNNYSDAIGDPLPNGSTLAYEIVKKIIAITKPVTMPNSNPNIIIDRNEIHNNVYSKYVTCLTTNTSQSVIIIILLYV